MQVCTARFDQIHDIDFVLQGFPINRTIQDAKILFQEVEEEEFLSLKSDDRYNITHPPASDKDIVSASPLHAYLRCFAWFFKLICHLVAGETDNWSSSSVSETKRVIISFIKERLSILIDAPSIQGGTSTTGNVARKCLTRDDDKDKDFLYWILTLVPQEYTQAVTDIYNNIGAILRVYNSSRRVDTEELEFACRGVYRLILEKFPWAYVSPTLHKLLAHATGIISHFNDGYGLETLSEEGIDACNKHIRRFRDRLSRKFSFEDNIRDIFIRLISQSDPILLLNRKSSKKKSDSSTLLSIQSRLVNSFISILLKLDCWMCVCVFVSLSRINKKD